MTYTVVTGDTFFSIAQQLGISVDALQAANPGVSATNLQVGQVLNVPGAASTGSTTYTIKSGDTLFSISQAAGISLAQLQAANPGLDANNLQVGQVINVPGSSGGQTPPVGPPSTSGNYVNYSGPASNFPNPNTWASYDTLWAQNSRLMKLNDSDSEIAFIKSGINTVSQESGVDARVIMCIVVQESGGDVRVHTTNNGVRNPGLMQSHNGVEFNPASPQASITQMIRDGTEGVSGPGGGDGLKQCFAAEHNWYGAFRKYNSGSVNEADLNDPKGATPSYVRDAANRLMAHTWSAM